MRSTKFNGTISSFSSYPWMLTREEHNDLYRGKTDKIEAKKLIILAIEEEIKSRERAIEIVKKL